MLRHLVTLLAVWSMALFSCAETPTIAPSTILTNGVAQDLFGLTVAADAHVLFVGAPGANALKGEVHVFYRDPLDSARWQHHQTLRPTASSPVLLFGNSLFYDHAGRLAVAGNHGPVFLFVRDGLNWTQEAVIHAGEDNDIGPNTISLDYDALAIGMSGDGPEEQGSVHIYRRGPSGWAFEAKVQAEHPQPGALLGTAVSLTANTLVAGAPGENNATGAAYLFEKDGATWVQRQRFTPSQPEPNLWFGQTLASSHEFIVIGAPGDGRISATPGRAFLYEYDFQGALNYRLVKELIPAEALPPRSRYGVFVAVSAHQVVVNQLPGADTTDLQLPGSAYVFTQRLTGWEERLRLSRADGQTGDAFGCSASIFNDLLAIGDYGNSGEPGTAHVYDVSVPRTSPIFLDAPEDQSLAAAPGQSVTATFHATIGDNDGNDLDAIWEVDGVEVQRDFIDSSGRFTLGTVTLTTTLAPGVHVVRIIADETSYEGISVHEFKVTVGDTTGPVIRSIQVDPSEVKSQHGRFFRARVTVDAVDPSGPVTWKIVSVTSSDPSQDRKHQLRDWTIIAKGKAVILRAITTEPNVDRVYTLQVEARDALGNVTNGQATVTILAPTPKAKPPKARPPQPRGGERISTDPKRPARR